MLLGGRSEANFHFLGFLTSAIDFRVRAILDGPHMLSQVLALDPGSVLQCLDAQVGSLSCRISLNRSSERGIALLGDFLELLLESAGQPLQLARLRGGQALGLRRRVDLITQCRGFSDEAVPFLLQGLRFRLQGGAIGREGLQRCYASVLER